jgi:glycosyltransferase involved in cell wall biosynthesis
MHAEKLRVFFLTAIPPIPTWGTAMAFYRHFIERDDFEIAVATDNPQVRQFPVNYPVTFLEPPKWLRRLQQTRLSPWMHAIQHFVTGRHVPSNVLQAAREFKPDFVLTVASSWSWMDDTAAQLARKLGVPLVGSFNDWFDYNLILPPMLKPRLEKRFHQFYRECDLALCTCEGMRDELGAHPNSILHYPIGATRSTGFSPLRKRGSAPFRILFGGNLGEWYGAMLEQLITAARDHGYLDHELEFVICGSNPIWSPDFDHYVREKNIYRGQVPFSQLQTEAENSDALLLLMGFDKANAQIERTSFKTKFLDYLSFDRPIVVWGPPYSSAARTSREFDSAQVCDSPEAVACLECLLGLNRDPKRQETLQSNARRMYEDRFRPDKIHEAFLTSCQKLVSSSRATSVK